MDKFVQTPVKAPRIQSFSPTGMTVNGRYIPWAPKEKNDAVK